MRRLRAFLAAAGLTIAAGGAAAATVTTADIVAKTILALPACLDWRIDGVCLWLKCSWLKCKVRTSLRVRNYTPDSVVTVRNDLAVHPWVEASPILAASSTALSAILGGLADGGGYIRQTRDGRRHQTYREADVLGHPLGAARFFEALSWLTGIVCPPRTWPLFPYFNSGVDALVWRAILPVESLQPAAWIPGLREIGTFPLNTWGPVYPRTGRVTQQDAPKANAVVAQRAGDIVTRWDQPHVYVPLGANLPGLGFRWFGDPPPLREKDPSTGKWQMLAPKTDDTCYAFGLNDSLLPLGWSDGFPTGRTDAGGDHVYNLWRPYRCCKRRGWFIGSVP